MPIQPMQALPLMTDQQQGFANTECVEQSMNGRTGFRIKVRGRLIQQPQLSITKQQLRNG